MRTFIVTAADWDAATRRAPWAALLTPEERDEIARRLANPDAGAVDHCPTRILRGSALVVGTILRRVGEFASKVTP